MEKDCKQCNKSISRDKKLSQKQWDKKKFCSQKCQWLGSDRSKQGGHNKGKRYTLKENPITPLQQRIRRCFEYRQWRSDIYTRDDFTCVLCEKRGGKLVADHIKSFRKIFYSENIKTFEDAIECSELWDINNGRTLCDECHRKTDNYGHKAKYE